MDHFLDFRRKKNFSGKSDEKLMTEEFHQLVAAIEGHIFAYLFNNVALGFGCSLQIKKLHLLYMVQHAMVQILNEKRSQKSCVAKL